MVLGKCSDSQVDFDGDIVSASWMATAVKDFLAGYPAIRLQHRGDYPAGRGLDAWQDPDGSTWLKSVIVDDQAKRMVKKRVLSAYSVGISSPQTRKSAQAPRWEIYGGRLTEVSLVDSPSNARCGITVCKSAAGGPAWKAWKAGKKGRPHPEASEVADPVTAMFLNSCNPALVALGEAGLRGS